MLRVMRVIGFTYNSHCQIFGMGDFFYDDGGATQTSAKRECRRAGTGAANVGASIFLHMVYLNGMKCMIQNY